MNAFTIHGMGRLAQTRSARARRRGVLQVVACLAATCGGAMHAAAQPILPDFASSAFDDSLTIDNPYFPLTPGLTLTYDSVKTAPDTGEVETEVIVVEILPQTRTVAGVQSRVVRDRVWREGLLIEDTFDWYAQDNAGAVWYLGEYVTDYLYDDDDNVIGTVHDGSWEAGVDGAKPGYLMLAQPQLGDFYYQEYYVGEAEDQGQVIGLGETHTIPLGTFADVLRTRDVSGLAPNDLEHKFYAPGIGKILGHHVDVTTGAIFGVTTLRSVVPEPGAAVLTGLGCAALCWRRAWRER